MGAGPGASFRVGRQLEVHLLVREPEHDAAVAGVVVEGVDPPEAEALLVEAKDVIEPVGRPGEADGRDRPLAAFIHALALVAGDRLVEEALLRARVVQVVVDDVVAEGGARHRPLLERRDRLAQRVGEALGVGLVGVALERRRQLELVLDPVAGRRRAARRRRGTGSTSPPGMRVSVRSAGAVADDAEAARAVVVAPGERRRRPASGGEALVRVDRRRDEDRELLQAGDLAGEVAA